jgi:hypothetical protein
MAAFLDLPAEDVARARHLYEQTAVRVEDIAEALGISMTTLHRRIQLWGWRGRYRRASAAAVLAAEAAQAAEAAAAGGEAASAAPIELAEAAEVAPADRRALAERVRAAVEREIAAIEQVLQRSCGARVRRTDSERTARTLAMLVRTLRELSTLEQAAQKHDEDGDDEGDEHAYRDLDAFRRELARRLAALRAAGAAR